jgi:hypothetical protein
LDFIEALYFRPLFSLWLIKKEVLTKKLLAIIQYLDYPLVCKMIFNQMREGKKQVLLFCDKNPENSLLVKTLLKIFREAKFIHMIRDARDNVNSHMKSFRGKNVYFIAQRWKGYNLAIEAEKGKNPSLFYTLYYEKLVTDTKTTMLSLCEFLRVPFNEVMLENHFPERIEAIKESKFFKRVSVMHQSMLSPINISNIGKWEKQMSKRNIAITEKITSGLAHDKYGYFISSQKNALKNVSHVKLFVSRTLYVVWELYTHLRYKNYRFNKLHYIQKMKTRPMGV